MYRNATPSRREFLKLTAGTAALGPFFLYGRRPGKTLKIASWSHSLPSYDRWFEDEYAREWGAQHDTKVVLSRIPVEQISARASSEVAAGTGHDLFMFPWPPAEYSWHAIDHTEIYQAVAAKHGNVNRIGHRSTFDPKTKRYFAFADSWMPAPLHYFRDYWGEAGVPLGPVHYDGLRSGGARIRAKLGIPCGLSFSPTLEGNITLHTLLYAFRSGVLGADGNVIIRNARTIAALKYAKALFQDAGTPEQLTWATSGNVAAMEARRTSCTTSAISLLREAESQDSNVARQILVSPPLVGSAGMMAVPYITSCSVVWNFARNTDGAKQFLVDLIDNFKTIYQKDQGCSFPTYQNTVPDLIRRLENDPKADPPYKYVRLKDALHWTPNLGFPGYATPVAMEVFNSFVIPRMFRSFVKGELSAEDAVQAAETAVKRISEKWSQTK